MLTCFKVFYPSFLVIRNFKTVNTRELNTHVALLPPEISSTFEAVKNKRLLNFLFGILLPKSLVVVFLFFFLRHLTKSVYAPNI